MRRYLALCFFLAFAFVLTGCTNKGDQDEITYFKATVLKVLDTSLLVEPLEGTPQRTSADQIDVRTDDITDEPSLLYLAEAAVGDLIQIGYRGGIAESYPAQIHGTHEIKRVAQAEALYDKIPMLMVDGNLYYDTGKESTIDGRCGVMDGEITSSVDATQTPTKDGQSNFGSGYGYQFGAKDQIEVCIDDKWFIFELRDDEAPISKSDAGSLSNE